MIQKRTFALLAVAICIVLAGCSTGTAGSDDESNDGSTDGTEWCQTGQSTEWSNPETGERVSLTIDGTTTHDGREVCVGSWQTDDPDSDAAKVEYWFSENGEYTRVVTYDAEGNVINEFESTTQVDDGTGTAGPDGDDSDTHSWCPTGQSIESASPQTGERISLVYEGVLTEDDLELCKAVWETDNPDDVAKMEYYFDEAGTYAKWVAYDENGTVVDETTVDSSQY